MRLPSAFEHVPEMVGEGIWFAKVYCAIAVVILLFRAPTLVVQQPLMLLAVVAAYFAAGIGAGFVVGVLYPIVNSFPGRILVSTIATMPVGFAMGLIVLEVNEWRNTLIPFAFWSGIVLGPAVGVVTWIGNRRK